MEPPTLQPSPTPPATLSGASPSASWRPAQSPLSRRALAARPGGWGSLLCLVPPAAPATNSPRSGSRSA
eukprot:14065271-Alexandrium_andersonii.AAC.1